MDRTYWQRQDPSQPLFANMLWSRPENRLQAGKLLIVGGNLHGFAAPGLAYVEAGKAGIGTTRVLLPDALRKLVGGFIENGEFAPSTPSGSFARQALDGWLEHAAWADAVLLAGDFGRNSETSIVLESFLRHASLPVVLTKDALDYALAMPTPLLDRPATVAVASVAQVQKLAQQVRSTTPVTYGMDLLHMIDALHQLTTQRPGIIITKHLGIFVAAVNGQIITTKPVADPAVWRVATAAHAAVWWLQNPRKPLEALATAVYEIAT